MIVEHRPLPKKVINRVANDRASGVYDLMMSSVFANQKMIDQLVRIWIKSPWYKIDVKKSFVSPVVVVVDPLEKKKKLKQSSFAITTKDLNDEKGCIFMFYKHVLLLKPDFSLIMMNMYLFENRAFVFPLSILSSYELTIIAGVYQMRNDIMDRQDYYGPYHIYQTRITQYSVPRDVRFRIMKTFHEHIVTSLLSPRSIPTSVPKKEFEEVGITTFGMMMRLIGRMFEQYGIHIRRLREEILRGNIPVEEGAERKWMVESLLIFETSAEKHAYDILQVAAGLPVLTHNIVVI